jgi:hypothetical protein
MPQPFEYPFTYWVGMDTDPRTTPEALAEFNRFYSTTHVGEVIAAHPGFVSASRYELVDGPDPSGPRWLAIYEMKDEAAAEQYLKDNARPWLHRQKYSPWPPARKRAKTVWRMLWRRIRGNSVADTMYLVGTNSEPDDTSAVKYELYRAFAPPAPACPRFCAIYNEPPDAADDAVWRLAYRRIPAPE